MGASSNSQLLRFKIGLGIGALGNVAELFWKHPQLSRIFPEYLFMLYCSMKATVPLMKVAEARARELEAVDPLAAPLRAYFSKHAREELHHDEWMLEDMALLGIQPEEVSARVPPPEVANLIGAQYYWLHHDHPIGLLGCFAVMEGSPMTQRLLNDVMARTGYPRRALRTLYKHARLDPYHRDDLDALLDQLKLTPRHTTLLGVSALTTVQHQGAFLKRLISLGDSPESRPLTM